MIFADTTLSEMLATVSSLTSTPLFRWPLPLRGDPRSNPARDFTSDSPPILTYRRLLPWHLLCSSKVLNCG
jgi:hypothetical protein